METKFVKFVLKFCSVSTPFCQEHSDSFKKTYSKSVSILDMNSSKFASVIYNSFPRLYRAISIRTKGFQSLAKFTKSSDVSQVHVFEQKTGLSTKDIDPLRRAIQRFRRVIRPLQRAVKLLRRAIKPLQRVFGGLFNLFVELFELFGGNKTSHSGGMMSLIASTIYKTCCSS